MTDILYNWTFLGNLSLSTFNIIIVISVFLIIYGVFELSKYMIYKLFFKDEKKEIEFLKYEINRQEKDVNM